jgi:hypothetical protein
MIATFGAAAFSGLQLVCRRIAKLDMKSPGDVILCVVIGIVVVALVAAAVFPLYLRIERVLLLTS